MIYKKFKNKLKSFFNGERAPSKKELRELIKSIRPFQTEYELIRLGGDSDGGYLVPNDLKGISACYSPGVGNVSEFEKDCHTEGMKIFMADSSVEDPFPNSDNFHFIKKNIGLKDSNQEISLSSWIKSNGLNNDSDLLLQMDIEGGEYKIFENISVETLKKFRIIVVEFHNIDRIGQRGAFNSIKKSFDNILRDHLCVHIHPNNYYGIKKVKGIEIPSIAEFTFLRRDRVKYMNLVNSFPHKLDRDNTNNVPVVLPQIWYKN